MPQGYGNLANEVLVSRFMSQHDVFMKLIIRKASVRWKGGSRGSARVMSTESGLLNRARYSSGIPGKADSALDPSELIAAAHAGSFTLALANELGSAGSASGDIVTTTTVTLEHLAGGWTITNLHLNVIAKLPKMTQREFIDATVRAETSCLVSRLLRATISMNAKLEQRGALPGLQGFKSNSEFSDTERRGKKVNAVRVKR
jgi:osmotically inducible protein OsmC